MKRLEDRTFHWIHIVFFFFLVTGLHAEEKESKEGETNQKKENEEINVLGKSSCPITTEVFSETRHEVMINGQLIAYKAMAGNIILKNDKCEPQASFFFISYTRETENSIQRPVTFCFNGGPGSSSVWLHLGVFGPRRVHLTENGDVVPPYRLVDNEFSILDITDLVFIDPVSTGYSRAIPVGNAKHFHGVEEDVKSVAEFIRLYVTRFNRWDSPKFLAGESYGTTRAAGLAGYLHDKYYMSMNGIILVSSILNFQSIDFSEGNDLAYLLFLPSYTAAAWYHKKLAPGLQANLSHTLDEVEDFVINEYSRALFKGNLIKSEERQRMINQLAHYTGLSPDYIDRSNLRIDMMRFAKELLRDSKRTIGRFDSRFKGIDYDAVGEYFEYDPSTEAVFGAFTATFNQYVREELKWNDDNHYKILTSVQPWDYGNATNQCLNVGETLRQVMIKNSYLRVFVANGYFDLATPYFATEYTFNHLNFDSSLADHVTMNYYDAGHMMYIHYPSLVKLKKDLSIYYKNTLQIQDRESSTLNIQR